jgi:hypothetical protein
MSRPSALLKDPGVDPLAIIANTYSKLILIISDFDFDVAGSSVREGIPDHLTGDPVDLILKHRRQSSLLPFDDYLEARKKPVGFLSTHQFMASRLQQFRKIALRGWFRAQVTNRSTALRNAFLRSMNRVINDPHCIVRISEQQFTGCLKLKRCSLETLQQCVMQLLRDARTLTHLRLEPYIKLMLQLPKAELIEEPQQQ